MTAAKYGDYFEGDDPYFVNDEGVKFWVEETLTKAAKNKFKDVKDIGVFVVEPLNKQPIYLIVKNGLPIYENTQYEAVATHLDIMKFMTTTDG